MFEWEILLGGCSFAALAAINWGSDKKVFKFFSILSFSIYTFLGILYGIFGYLYIRGYDITSGDIDFRITSILSFIFAAFFFSVFLRTFERELQISRQSYNTRLSPIILLFIGTLSLFTASTLYLLYIINPDIFKNELLFNAEKVPLMILIIGISIAIIIAISINAVGGRIEKRGKFLNAGVWISIDRHKCIKVFLLFTVTLLVFFTVDYFYTGEILVYEGKVSDAGQAIGIIYWSIMGSPLFVITAVLVLIGGLAKVVSASKASNLISNVLIYWLPAFGWILVLTGYIEPPKAIISTFEVKFLAYLIYLMVYGTIMLALSAIISVFNSFRMPNE
ncbi:MAG: hypothetical protein ACP6IY_21290 [Promethearchaeia archaeon]